MSADLQHLSLDIATLSRGYRSGDFTPAQLVAALRQKSELYRDRNIWIHPLSEAEIAPYLKRLEGRDPAALPLYGIPFAIKDNIDLAGIATTAACPAFAYTPEQDAYLVALLLAAGAVPVGKTNLDQFATGLSGARSPDPWGPCRNAFDPDYISGGSSSGSAVAVALGLASFALGTDTAGSGRVPAAFNNLVGVKPTRGVLSARGMVPACRTLDTASIFALTPGDARRVLDVAAGYDKDDPYARPLSDRLCPARFRSPAGFRFAVPPENQLRFFGNADGPGLFAEAVARLEAMGGSPVERDFSPFFEAATLLYQGPWVAERYAAVEDLIDSKAEALHPVIRKIIAPAREISAVSAFKAEYRMQAYRRRAEDAFADVDVAITPTAGSLYSLEAMLDDPIGLNNDLGYYTNFMNLLDLAAVAVPAGFQSDGLPWGVTLFAPAGADRALLGLADVFLDDPDRPLGATGLSAPGQTGEAGAFSSPDWTTLVVCGAHMSGMPLNRELADRGGLLVRQTTTAPRYRLHALAGGPPQRPGLERDDNGVAIDVELWTLPMKAVGGFLDGIPAPLGLGRVELADGSWHTGFICEPWGLDGSRDISHLGSWRVFCEELDGG